MTLAVVRCPVSNLRKVPEEGGSLYFKDTLQETQLLYNEQVEIVDELGDWFKIKAKEQLKWHPQEGWVGYPGWIKKEALLPLINVVIPNIAVIKPWANILNDFDKKILSVSFGTLLNGVEIDNDFLRIQLVDGSIGKILATDIQSLTKPLDRLQLLDFGKQFLGFPYLWGGRSAYDPIQSYPLTGVDCSSLCHLLFRVFGISIPRDAHDQFQYCEKLTKEKLQIGDLVFKEDLNFPNHIDHVMLYAGNDSLLEAKLLPQKVQMISFSDLSDSSLSYGNSIVQEKISCIS